MWFGKYELISYTFAAINGWLRMGMGLNNGRTATGGRQGAKRIALVLGLMLFCCQQAAVWGQTAESDSTAARDTMAQDTAAVQKSTLEAPVAYQATDSIVMTAGNWAYLYGNGNVKYQQIELQSEHITISMDNSLVYATFGLDTAGQEFGYPLFKQGEEAYESKTMRYNFKTQKGFSTGSITQQGEGFVTANYTKKMADDILNMADGKYTTCDDHDHPHFYIKLSKAKVRPRKNIVTGPVYLVIEDVPLPVGLPFAFFPFSSEYSSGILMPTYGDESTRGFNLRDGGYYFALSDYMDLAVTGEIYSKGSWGLAAKSGYRKRYKYSGNFNASYLVTKTSDKGLPDYSASKDFKIQWSHSQDAKANPFRSFSASVNFATSSYDRNNTGSYYPGGAGGYADATQNNKGSSVSVTQRFPNSPFSLSGTMNINQRSRDSAIAVTLPDVTLTLTRIFPFKRKNGVGKDRWYEKISMSYTGYLRNSIDTKESLLFKSDLVKDWKNAMQHTIPVSATFNVFQYLNLTASANYKERWYTSKIEQEYDPARRMAMPSDTTYGFYRLYDYNASLSAATTVYGDFIFLPFLQKLTKIKQIRHRLEPSVSLSASPDFGSSYFGFYNTYSYTGTDGREITQVYSPFQHNQFGVPGQGKSGSVNFSLDNVVEAKIISDKDSTGERKISLIDKLSAGMSYNMAADSFQWSDMNVGLRLKFSRAYTLSLNGTFDTYTYRIVGEDNNRRLERQSIPRWQAGKGFGRLMSTGTSFSYTFNNETFNKWLGKDKKDNKNADANAKTPDPDDPFAEEDGQYDDEKPSASGGRLLGAKQEKGEADADGYLNTAIPWSLSFSYSMRLAYDRQKIDFERREYKYAVTHSLSFNGDLQPTKNWHFNFNATYDFDTRRISYMTCNITRDLHCFQMSGSFVPVGPYKSYSFAVSVSSSLLKDLKYNQTSNYRDAQRWY
ncbi:Organic solvent tolerance protein OstA [Bacteroidales bacterium Barb6]|nr:Organic solvent tolerance protein OstA [Bacteroidales bacterium Barb6]